MFLILIYFFYFNIEKYKTFKKKKATKKKKNI